MKRHTMSSAGLSADNSTTLYNRSYTPAEIKSKKVSLPSIIDDTNFMSKLSFSEKKYSILNVPKTRSRQSRIFRETSRDFKISIENTQSAEPDERPFKAYRSDKISLAKLCKIRRTYRPNRTINKENLQAELLKLKRQRSENEPVFNKNDVAEKKDMKSDIEEILESQEFVKNHKKKWKKPGIYINLCNVCEEPEKEANANDNFSSESSPIKEVICKKECPKSRTPNTFKKAFRSKIPSLHILSESKVGKEILEKIEESKNRILRKSIRRNSPKQDFFEKQLINYQQESLKVLKNTAFLAERIMKDIRGGAKIKNLCVL